MMSSYGQLARALTLVCVALLLIAATRQWPLLETEIPGIGMVHCSGKAAAPPEYRRKIQCMDSRGRMLTSVFIGEKGEPKKTGIELQKRSIPGLPDPLLVGVAASPHGSSTNWQIVLLALVEGKLKTLRTAPFEIWTEGGIFIGDLGGELGPGVAIWEFLWDDCHACPSRFEVQFYPWSRETATVARAPVSKQRSTKRFATGIEAVHSLGLPYTNMLEDFRGLRAYW
jgi:hypothetical protein